MHCKGTAIREARKVLSIITNWRVHRQACHIIAVLANVPPTNILGIFIRTKQNFYHIHIAFWILSAKMNVAQIYVMSKLLIWNVLLFIAWTRQNGRLFADDIFRYIFLNEKFCILITISLKLVPKSLIDNNCSRVGSNHGLALNRQQATIWTNADLIHWRIYAALGGD